MENKQANLENQHVQQLKDNTKIDNKYIPIINAILGIALAFWMKGFSFDVALVGLVSGWASTGCYEAIRNMSQGGK